MSDQRLALLGGTPVNSEPWPVSNTIGEEEKKAVMAVLDSGVLSGFRAVPGEDFYGGPQVRGLENEWSAYFGVSHSVSFNSLTSGLFAAVGASCIGPGDEVIVSPYTMAASVTCVVAYGGIPVFADLDPESYCLDPVSIEERITPRTKAIVIVHLFGYPSDMDRIMDIANRYNLTVIEDCAQAPAGQYRGRYVGTIGHIGGFSLNRHKTIQAGEGGMMITEDPELALRMQLIRNHGEVTVEAFGLEDVANTFGGNTRMTEMEAAVAREQLKKLDGLNAARIRLAHHLDRRLTEIPGIEPQRVQHTGDKHVYYLYTMHYDESIVGLPRDLFAEAVRAEGVELREAYVKPIYLEPMFQQKRAFSKGQFPFSSEFHDANVSYDKGICPVTEAAYEHELIFGSFVRWPLTESHMDQVADAFKKVIANRDVLLAAKAT
jgi:perosamine synthetase